MQCVYSWDQQQQKIVSVSTEKKRTVKNVQMNFSCVDKNAGFRLEFTACCWNFTIWKRDGIFMAMVLEFYLQ